MKVDHTIDITLESSLHKICESTKIGIYFKPRLQNWKFKNQNTSFIELQKQVEVWGNKKCCWNMSQRQVFPLHFQDLLNLHQYFYNSTETHRTCFLHLFENTATKKNGKQLVNFDYQSVNSRCLLHHYVNSSGQFCVYRNMIFNKSAPIFSQDCFLNSID